MHLRSGAGYPAAPPRRQGMLSFSQSKRLVDPRMKDHPGQGKHARGSSFDWEKYVYRPPGRGPPGGIPAAVDAAVQRYIRGSATRGMRKQTLAISSLPKMTSSSGGFVIKHRECIGLVKSSSVDTAYRPCQPIGSSLFDTIGMRLFPTNADAFPWLSTIASRFEQYRWRKVNVQFITASGDGTTAQTGQGNVMAYIEYNPVTANNPINSRDFMNNYGAVACKPSQSFQMGVEARGNPFELKWTTPPAAGAAAQDQRFFADGSLYLASEGVTVSTPMGYLYIDYEIELHKPQVPSP